MNSSFDLLGRATARSVTLAPEIEGTTYEAYQFDGLSRVARAENDDTVVTFAYDSVSNVSNETQQLLPAGPVRTVTSSYDGVGNRLACTYPSGQVVNTTYDPGNRPLHISTPSSLLTYIASYSYPGCTMMVRDYGNGASTTNVFDLLGRQTLTQVDSLIDMTNIDYRTYAWDAAGNQTAMNDLQTPALNSKSFAYDSANRLVSSQTAGGGPEHRLHLDGVGNRLAVTGGAQAGAYSMSAAAPPGDFQVNQYTSTPFDTRASDANGNLKNAGSREFRYDYH